MLKSEFLLMVEKNLGKHSSGLQQEQIRAIQRKEEVEKILSRSNSVSFNDLVKIRNVCNLIFAALCLTVNSLISHSLQKKVLKGQ